MRHCPSTAEAGTRATSWAPPLAAALAFLAVMTPRVARADDGSVSIQYDRLGRIQAVVPRQNRVVQMVAEEVVIVPFFNRKVSAHPVFLVNARFDFKNPGPTATVLMGFPELKGIHEATYVPGDPESGERKQHSRTVLGRSTIAAFSASHAGKQLKVQRLPGKDPYRNWFVFHVPMTQGQRTQVKNLFVAYASRYASQESSGCDTSVRAEYVLHTGATWKGVIGRGVVRLRAGGFDLTKRFQRLKPTPKDDLVIDVGSFDDPTPDTGCGTFNVNRLVHASSARPGAAYRHYSALVLDDDPDTAWIDDEAKGAVGAWVQIPTRLRHPGDALTDDPGPMRRVRGVTVQAGPIGPGLTRAKEIELSCLGQRCRVVDRKVGEDEVTVKDCDGRRRRLGTFTLSNTSARHTLRFKRRPRCGALRVTVRSVHGQPTDHVSIAAIEPLF